MQLTEMQARQQLSASGARMLASRTFSRARREAGGWSFHPVGVPAQIQLVGDRSVVVSDHGLVAELTADSSPEQLLSRLDADHRAGELDW